MTVTASAEHENIREYTMEEFREIQQAEHIHGEDATYLVGFDNYAEFILVGEEYRLVGMTPYNLLTFEVEDHPTGMVRRVGQHPFLLLNARRTILEYNSISEFHPMPDATLYAWLLHPWTEDDIDEDECGNMGVWPRDEVYKEHMPPYTGDELDWPDKPPVQINK